MSTGRSRRENSKGQPCGCATDGEATGCQDRKIGREPAAADARADGNLAHRVAGDRGENGKHGLRPAQSIRGETQHRDGDRVDIDEPTKIAPVTAPVAPNASPTARPSTMITPRKTANPTTDRRSNGLRNFTLRYSSRLAFCQIVQATANPTAVSAAAMSAGATSTRSSGLSTVTMPTTRRNITADATATPAASSRGGPSRAAARRALAMVTAVEDATPPAAAASSNPRRAPKCDNNTAYITQ